MQRLDVGHHQAQQEQGKRDDVQRIEAVEGGVGNDEITPDPQGERLTDEGQRTEERDDDLRAPVRHLSPGQQIAEERLRHEAQVDEHPDNPQQLAGSLERAVHHATKHVEVHDDEEEGGAGGVHVADEPPPLHVPHDELDAPERLLGVGLVIHREPDAAQELEREHHQRQGTEEVPEIEVLRSVIAGRVLVPQLAQRKAGIGPLEQPGEQRPHQAVSPPSSPISSTVSERYW